MQENVHSDPRLVFLSLLIGWKSGARTLNQSLSEVIQNQIHSIENRSYLSSLVQGSLVHFLKLVLLEFIFIYMPYTTVLDYKCSLN